MNLGKLLISEPNRKQKVLCESCSQWSVHCKTLNKNHLRRRKRELLALMAADVWVWVYNSTVYNTKGTTWSGSPPWKQAQQEVQQHWFIDSYIAAYIQVQYRVTGVHPTGLTVARGVGRCPQWSYWTDLSHLQSRLPLDAIFFRWVWNNNSILVAERGLSQRI